MFFYSRGLTAPAAAHIMPVSMKRNIVAVAHFLNNNNNNTGVAAAEPELRA